MSGMIALTNLLSDDTSGVRFLISAEQHTLLEDTVDSMLADQSSPHPMGCVPLVASAVLELRRLFAMPPLTLPA